MGAAPETLQNAEPTQEQTRDTERQWLLDAETGELKPDEKSDHDPHDPHDRPRPVRAARWIFD